MLGFLSGTLFSYMLVIGFIFSLVSFIVSTVGGSLGGSGGDVGDMGDLGDMASDTGFDGDASDGGTQTGAAGILAILFPTSPVVWSILLLVSGVMGEVMLRVSKVSYALCMVLSLFVGYLSMLLFHKFFLLPMKNATNYAHSESDLIGAEAVVFEPIAEGDNRKGAIQVKGSSGSVIYTAVSENGSEMKRGSVVRVVDLKPDKTAVVVPDPAQQFFESVEKGDVL